MNVIPEPKTLRRAIARPLRLGAPVTAIRRPLIGEILTRSGELSAGNLIKAIALRAHEEASLGDILLAHRMVSEDALYRGLAQQYQCAFVDLEEEPPDARLIDDFGVQLCLKNGLVPWKRIGATTVVVTSRPEEFSNIRQQLPVGFGTILMAIARPSAVQTALLDLRREQLTSQAQQRVPHNQSCRDWNTGVTGRFVVAGFLLIMSGSILAPTLTLSACTIWAVLALVLNTLLKIGAAWATFSSARESVPHFQSNRITRRAMRLPKISILVPLFQENQIANRLIRRLSRISYPLELLDICLIVEEDDRVTQSALSAIELPIWMREIRVPRAELKTKPRALNYALDFCRGSIIGVYDAEDAPEPDQLHKVARRFQERGPSVACLQGVLDFYNPRQNWLSRCFTIEYATWFRVVLPGLERMGLVIPLGGTTVFFRREALECVGGWDAHNVTEDADLGVRLARNGYQTELLPTMTEEEANCRAWPWVRQRSRWLKGYALTWAVHMRQPRQLWRDLGPKRFFGLQILFLGTLSQFALAPLLWSFWLLPLGVAHPFVEVLPSTWLFILFLAFFVTEITIMAVGIFALSPVRHRWLWLWAPVLHVYFALATVAAYKGIWELVSRPFYWDKTSHGHDGEAQQKLKETAYKRHRFKVLRYLRQA